MNTSRVFAAPVNRAMRSRSSRSSTTRWTERSTGRTISYHQAQFMQFRDGKIIEYRGIIDSFNAAEQMIGHSIELPKSLCVPSHGNLIAI